jgi:peptidoglycan/xylan/chitin deacetylase (PgdA/CDA1 family)
MDMANFTRMMPRVFMYHAFDTTDQLADPLKLTVTIASLDEQLHWLHTRRWRFLDVDGYITARANSRAQRAASVTVDDGYRSFTELALPCFQRHAVPTLLFVPPALIGRIGVNVATPGGELIDANELRAIADDGVEIGVHGWDHRVMVGLDDQALRQSVVEARDAVADLIGRVPRTFAYPEGRFDERSRRAVAAAGYALAFAVHDDDGPYAISRVDVNATDTLRSFRVKTIPGYRRLWRAANRVSFVRRAPRPVLGADR